MNWEYKNIDSCKNRTCASYSNVWYGGIKDFLGCFSNCTYYIRTEIMDGKELKKIGICKFGHDLNIFKIRDGDEKLFIIVPSCFLNNWKIIKGGMVWKDYQK